MSLQFSNTTTKNGIIQTIERNCALGDGAISGDSTALLYFTGDVNAAIDKVVSIALKSSGTWQFDDSTQSDYPIIKTNIVSSQRDYPFTTDGSGNLILDVYKVLILPSATSTIYQEIYPIDQQSQRTGIDTEDGATGTPFQYDKTANALIFDPTPNYNATNGIKMLINREMLYFSSTDTTKKAGFAGIFHEYLALRPSYQYAQRKTLANTVVLGDEMLKMEKEIYDYYARRERDKRKVLGAKYQEFR